jgi:hypothetical protein
LAKEYAARVTKAFKTTLQMEWWRYLLKVKAEEVSVAQRSWLPSKHAEEAVAPYYLQGFDVVEAGMGCRGH